MTELLYKQLSYDVQGAFYEVYKTFRNTQKEIIYHNALIKEIKGKGCEVEKEKRIDVYFKGEKVGTYVPDLIVNNKIMIELKCKPFFHKDDIKQFWHYLKCSSYKIGYLVNFGKPDGVDIIRRVYDTARKV